MSSTLSLNTRRLVPSEPYFTDRVLTPFSLGVLVRSPQHRPELLPPGLDEFLAGYFTEPDLAQGHHLPIDEVEASITKRDEIVRDSNPIAKGPRPAPNLRLRGARLGEELAVAHQDVAQEAQHALAVDLAVVRQEESHPNLPEAAPESPLQDAPRQLCRHPLHPEDQPHRG